MDNKTSAVNVLLPGTLRRHNLLQMLEADVQLEVTERDGWMGGVKSVLKKQKGVESLKNEWD